MLQDWVPKHKSDIERAERCIALGYPAVAPIIPDLLEWMQDYNWPVAQVLAPFLATIGEPLLTEIRRILATDDDVWKYWILIRIVATSPALAEQLRPELSRLAQFPTRTEMEEELHIHAQEILENL
jgi:hypothetical protein